jgi:hypothetical protein
MFTFLSPPFTTLFRVPVSGGRFRKKITSNETTPLFPIFYCSIYVRQSYCETGGTGRFKTCIYLYVHNFRS